MCGHMPTTKAFDDGAKNSTNDDPAGEVLYRMDRGDIFVAHTGAGHVDGRLVARYRGTTQYETPTGYQTLHLFDEVDSNRTFVLTDEDYQGMFSQHLHGPKAQVVEEAGLSNVYKNSPDERVISKLEGAGKDDLFTLNFESVIHSPLWIWEENDDPQRDPATDPAGDMYADTPLGTFGVWDSEDNCPHV